LKVSVPDDFMSSFPTVLFRIYGDMAASFYDPEQEPVRVRVIWLGLDLKLLSFSFYVPTFTLNLTLTLTLTLTLIAPQELSVFKTLSHYRMAPKCIANGEGWR